MTSQTAGSLDMLNTLLEERSRYEQWLAQLASRREQTPPHVYERVRLDYATRLDAVMVQLRSRGDELGASAQSMEDQVNALLAEETARRDARAEVELRSMVGEYGPERAESELAACDADITRLDRERQAIMVELQKVQEILSHVRQPVAAPPAAPAPPRSAPPPPPRSAPPQGPRNTDAAAAFDELAFLQSVVDRPEPVNAGPGATEPPPVLNGPAPIAAAPAEPAARPRQASGTPNATPAFLKDMPTEQVKTLRCQECGTMNYPTEWYCERCGGELAAM